MIIASVKARSLHLYCKGWILDLFVVEIIKLFVQMHEKDLEFNLVELDETGTRFFFNSRVYQPTSIKNRSKPK